MRFHSLLLVTGLGLGACTSQSGNPQQFVLNGPSDVAFACVGTTAVPDGGVGELRAFPTASCGGDPSRPPPRCTSSDAGPVDAGPPRPGLPTQPSQVYFIPEKASGTLQVAQFGGSNSSFVDQDPFTPGINGVAVGRLPVAATVTSDGCWVAVSNSGSCDLAVVDVIRASAAKPDPVRVRSAVAGLERTRPSEIVSLPSIPYNTTPLPNCRSPSGIAFVAYPSCHLVARVDLSTFQMLDGIHFNAGQAPEIVGPDFDFNQCPSECQARGGALGAPVDGDAGPEDAGPEDAGAGPEPDTRPAAMAMESDGSRLYIGTSDSGNLLTVTLDATGRPTAVDATPLEGATGIRKVSATGEVKMGEGAGAPVLRYVYAIGDDQAIHVMDVTPGRVPGECDTQLDRRYLRDINSATRLACLRVGDPTNPPRRPEAIGPAIRLPNGVLPIDIGFEPSFRCDDPPPKADVLRGFFAVVAALGPASSPPRGIGYFINVTDWMYPSFQGNVTDRTVPDIAFGFPQSLRDDTLGRWTPPLSTCQEENLPDNSGNYRLTLTYPLLVNNDIASNATAEADDELQPGLRRVKAEALVDDTSTVKGGDFRDACEGSLLIVPELSSIAPMSLRQELWPDATLVGRGEQFNVVFEGPFAQEDARSRRSGGAISVGGAGQMRLDAAGANLCGLGPQPRDIVRLLGCTSPGDCATDETCYVHPRAPVGVGGMCVPSDRILEYSADCLGLLVSVRRYTAVETADDHVTFVVRPRTLPETPIDGCSSSEQCEAIEEAVLSKREAANAEPPRTRPRHTYECLPVPDIGAGNRCVETCSDQRDCEGGTFCDRGTCVLGPAPDPKCVAPLQRYELRAGDSFTVVSNINGYRHREVRGVDGKCVLDPTRSPLLNARILRDAPPCTDTGVGSLEPNPCTLGPEVGDAVVATVDGKEQVINRPTHAIRLRTPGLTFDVVDISQPLTITVGGVSQTVRYSPVQFGAGYQLQVSGGFFPFIETAVQANLPVRIRKGVEGALYVVDAGDDGSGGGIKGQIISVIGNSSNTAVSPIRLY